MKIYSMTATFGKLEHATLTLQPGLNILQGPNEWGKSTWCAFLTAMLYGIDTRERTTADHLSVKEHYAPWSGAPMAGRIDLCWNGRDVTIERTTRGRTPMGIFRAYETATGIDIPELTADNCGRLLLGCEKSVFTRSAFIRLSDMPVTQDEALRRRLNDLVTTGDESGQSDALAQKLRDLKNKVRANRANGLIPQALQEQAVWEQKLRRLDDLALQKTRLETRQAELQRHTAALQNHKQHLAWAAAQSHAQRVAEANEKRLQADAQVQILENMCRELPSEAELLSQAARARELNARKDSLQLELAMLPAAPAAPEIPACFRENDMQQVKNDFQTVTAARVRHRRPLALLILAIAGLAAMAAALVLTFLQKYLPGAITLVLGGAMAVTGLVLYNRKNGRYHNVQALLERYHPCPPEHWITQAAEAAKKLSAHEAALAAWESRRSHLLSQLQQVMEQLSALPATDGHSQALETHRQLQNALRERQHLQHLAQTLADTGRLPDRPTTPDDLRYTESETARLLSDAEAESRHLTAQLGSLSGQLITIGSREEAAEKLAAVNARLAKLEQTYAALELAQAALQQANLSLQRRFAPAIAGAARENFARITGGRYDRLTLSDDLSVQAAALGEDTMTSGLWRSDGTADQLYLSLRLAVADALTPDAPLVLDDALARFDDTRMAAALSLLQSLSAQKQILLFTCHTREHQAISN